MIVEIENTRKSSGHLSGSFAGTLCQNSGDLRLLDLQITVQTTKSKTTFRLPARQKYPKVSLLDRGYQLSTMHTTDPPKVEIASRGLVLPVREISVFLTVFIILNCIVGNGFLLTVLCSKRYRSNPVHYHLLFLINMTLADILEACNWLFLFMLNTLFDYNPVMARKQCITSECFGNIFYTVSL